MINHFISIAAFVTAFLMEAMRSKLFFTMLGLLPIAIFFGKVLLQVRGK